MIGVASRELAEGALEQRFREPSTRSSPIRDEDVIENVLKRLKYVSGDYREQSTFEKLKEALEASAASALLPRDPAEPLRRRRRKGSPRGLNKDAPGRRREAVRSRPRVGRRAQRDPAQRVRRERDLPHRPLPRQGVGREPARVPLRELAARAGLEQPLHQLGADHDGRGVRRRRARQVLRRGRARCATSCRTTCCEIVALLAMEPPVDADARRASRDEKVKLFKPGRARSIRPRRCAGSTAATSTKTACTPAPTPRRSSRCASRSTRGGGPACRCSSAPASRCAGTATEAVVEFKRAAAAVLQAAGHADARSEPPALPPRARTTASCCICKRRHPASAWSRRQVDLEVTYEQVFGARQSPTSACSRTRWTATATRFGRERQPRSSSGASSTRAAQSRPRAPLHEGHVGPARPRRVSCRTAAAGTSRSSDRPGYVSG